MAIGYIAFLTSSEAATILRWLRELLPGPKPLPASDPPLNWSSGAHVVQAAWRSFEQRVTGRRVVESAGQDVRRRMNRHGFVSELLETRGGLEQVVGPGQ